MNPHSTQTSVALALWLALVPILSVNATRFGAHVMLTVPTVCTVERGSCHQGSSDSQTCTPRSNQAPVHPTCCICICLSDLSMVQAHGMVVGPIEPLVGTLGPQSTAVVSRTIRPPVPPPKVS